MAILTPAEVKGALGARIDGTEFDADLPGLIARVQAMLEHECGLESGDLDAATDNGAKQAALGVCVVIVDNPAAGRDELNAILRSALLDAVRTYI